MDRPDDRRLVARRFRALRLRALLTQAHLGTILDLRRQSVNEIENCRVMPHAKSWDHFCALENRHRVNKTVRSPARWR
jgi:DNA-binding XRE family transcriptional regulator